MKYQYNIYLKTIFAGMILLLAITTGVFSQANKVQMIQVTVKINDENGEALPDVTVVVGEGLIHGQTDGQGAFTFHAREKEIVTISKDGYEQKTAQVSFLSRNSDVVLKQVALFKASKDVINLPFGNTNYRRNTTGAYNTLTSAQLEKYPSNDLRNALVGLIPGVQVTELEGSTGVMSQETLGSYGTIPKVLVYARNRSLRYLIDGIPIHITEMPLDPQEIESVTMVTDVVGKSMYGAQTADGVILINTKRGQKNERILNVNVEGGANVVDRFPEWTLGADYARLNNQARQNSGLEGLYDESRIAAYEKNDAYDKVNPSVDFRSMMLKSAKPYYRANISSSGGNDIAQYFAYLGYSGEGDLYKLGHTSDYNRINARTNVDVNLNKFLKVQFDFFAGISLRRSPNYMYNPNYTSEDGNSNTALRLQEFPKVINAITTLPPNAFPVYADFDPETGTPWYAVTQQYPQNPIGDLTNCGYYTETGRTGAANVSLEYDISHLVKGLKSQTDINFNIYNFTRIGKAEQYTAYIVNPTLQPNGEYTIDLQWKQNSVSMPGKAKLEDYYTQLLTFTQVFRYGRSFGVHDVQSSLSYYISKYLRNGVEEPMRQQNLLWTGMYTYNNKYAVQGALAYNGAASFAAGKRYKLFPSIGASWVISDEAFMEFASPWLDFLKLRVEYGLIGYDNLLWDRQYYMTTDRWSTGTGQTFGPHTSNQWFGSTADGSGSYTATYNRIGNSDLTWETRKELSVGMDALLLQRRLSLGITYYNILRDDIVVRIQENYFPLAAGYLAYPFYNYNKFRNYGAEFALYYTDRAGDFRYSVGGNAAVQNSKLIRYYELPYANDYQKRTGTPEDAIYGLEYLGRFEDDEEASRASQLFDETLSKGDLKYADLNGDGAVDDNDQKQIGHGDPRLVYAFNLNFAYKRFDLTIVANGQAFYDMPLTTNYYWNGWGDGNYSKFVHDNIDGDYPRLTYNKVNGNFRTSKFWLRKGDYFKVQNIEIGYNLKLKPYNRLSLQGVRFFVRGANLLTLSGIKDCDPESLSSGVNYLYPLNRTFTGGFKLTF